MLELISPQIDYVIFILVCTCALATITYWLWQTQRSSRTLIIAWLALPILLVPGWFLVNTAGQRERDRLRRRIEGLAPTYAEELRSMGHAQITADSNPDDPLYLAMIQKQIRWLEINRAVADIYTFRKHPDGNELIVDSETDYDHDGVYQGDRESRTVIGEIWNEDDNAIDRAYNGTAAFHDEIYTDRWGTWVSAYVPMLDQENTVEAVLGVDFPAEDWILAISRARRFAIGFLAVIATIGLSSASIIAVLRANLVERERAATDLLIAKNAAEAATKSKSEFLANMSHEIRTPMNGIIGMTDLLSGTQLNGQQQEYLRIVKQSANSLLGLLNDILDFSKIEAGKLELESIRFGLRDSVERTVQTLTFRAGEKGLEICCRIDPDLPDALIGDPGRLSQVLVNLAGNAIKFTEEGEVVINVEQESLCDDRVSLRCSVRDSGIGIAADKLETIFSAFSQEDASTTRRFGGTGLGLAICSQLVMLMGGRIWAESEKGVGTTFFFTSSFELAGETTPKLPRLGALEGMPVLVVDDNKTNRFILEELMKLWQMKPVLADSGPTALAEMKRAAMHGHPYELALIDCMMPDMDGFEFSEIIRTDPEFRRCQLVMLSSAASADDHQRCRELGIARYMTKPVIQSDLLDAILEITTVGSVTDDALAQVDQQVQSIDPGESAESCPPLNILLAEDGVINQMVATEMLKKYEHKVVIAENGREAVEEFRKKSFDLVLMDVQMPEMDGLEATVAIRQLERGSNHHTPIIAMTASAMKGDREMCLEAGMDSYLPKPIEARDLYEMIARHAPSAATPQDEIKPDEASEKASTNGLARNQEESTIIDLDAALSNVAGGRQALQQLVPFLRQECEDMMGLIRDGLATDDAKKVQRGAHTIKGAASVFAAKQVVDAALELERIGKDDHLDDAPPELQKLEELVTILDKELQSIMTSASDG